MKLGEALSKRANTAQKLNDLQGRIKANALTQEGENPPEDAGILIQEYLRVSDEHSNLVEKIATTNATTSINGNGETLLSLLQHRERLQRERALYRMTAATATPTRDRFYRNEIKFVAQVVVQELQTKAEDLDGTIQSLDAKLQQLNWQTDLVE